MIGIFSALTPVFLLILLGYVIRQRSLLPDEFWAPAEKMTYFVFFPALLLSNTAKAEFGDIDVMPMIVASTAGVTLVAIATALLHPFMKLQGPAFTSVFQGTIRPNVYLGIAAAVALFGDEGLTRVSVCVAVIVPLVNLLSVIILLRHAGETGKAPDWLQTLGMVARNPLILACLGGTALNVGDVGLPPLIGPFLEILGRASLPIGLLAVGAGLDLAAARRAHRWVSLTSAIKLLILPGLTYAFCLLMGVDQMTMVVTVMYASLPVSATSYVLARQLGGDTSLLAGVITATTIAAAITMPSIVALLDQTS